VYSAGYQLLPTILNRIPTSPRRYFSVCWKVSESKHPAASRAAWRTMKSYYPRSRRPFSSYKSEEPPILSRLCLNWPLSLKRSPTPLKNVVPPSPTWKISLRLLRLWNPLWISFTTWEKTSLSTDNRFSKIVKICSLTTMLNSGNSSERALVMLWRNFWSALAQNHWWLLNSVNTTPSNCSKAFYSGSDLPSPVASKPASETALRSSIKLRMLSPN